ncbi:MAG: SPOR domain-containing protein, partial [Brevinematia bacterium]
QISSYEKKELAESIAKKLKEAGLNSFIQEVTLNGKKIYRVRAGEFKSYEEATKALEKARRINKESFLVVSK